MDQEKNTLDISKVKAQESAELAICYPDGSETGVTFILQSVDASAPRRVMKKWDKIATKKKSGLDFDQKEQATVEILMACTIDWKNLTDGGVEVECTEENKRALYTNKDLKFIRTQVDEFVGDATSFFSMTEAT